MIRIIREGASPFPTNAASAFHAPISRRHLEEEGLESPTPPIGIRKLCLESKKLPLSSGYESETDDEEVKLNCIGGVQPYMTSDDEDDFEDDDQSCCSDDSQAEIEEMGVLTFVARQISQAPEICRPKAMMGLIQEEDDLETSSICSCESIEQAEVEMDDASSMGEAFSDADDERSDDEDLEESVQLDDELGGESSDEDEEEEESVASSVSFTRVESPELVHCVTSSQGTPEVCDEDLDDHDSSSRFCDYDGHSTEIIDRVLALDSETIKLPSSDIYPSSKSKRILSTLFEDEPDLEESIDTPKRLRCTLSTQSPMTSLFLGPSAYDSLGKADVRDTGESPFSIQEAEQDRQLSEELTEPETGSERESTPVPLLSPPPSPLCVESEKGQLTTVCEWPSNLAVDYAMTMATGLRAHSPKSLLRLDEERITAYYKEIDCGGTGLTPLLQGIRVNLD